MRFKKDGKVYNVIDAVHEYCKNTDCLECKLYDKNTNMCVDVRPERAAILMGYEAIEDDTPTIDEAVEENSGNVKRRLTRADILHAAEKCVCGQRETDYGTPEDNFKTIAELWEAYLNKACIRGVNVRVEAKDVAVMMALLKIARIAAGGGKADSWIDLAGYAACGAE
jgi:hypothetical protein|nr:MAG TPA: hypothetical protein [Caudoviricetes sp.]